MVEYKPYRPHTPNEVHINEPDFFSTVYSSGKSKVNKDSSTEAPRLATPAQRSQP